MGGPVDWRKVRVGIMQERDIGSVKDARRRQRQDIFIGEDVFGNNYIKFPSLHLPRF